MSNQEILEKAIEKAIAGGWDRFGNDDWDAVDIAGSALNEVGPAYSLYEIIFNHDFAKALWGTNADLIKKHGRGGYLHGDWSFHLQTMVIADDPIAYLGDHLDG